MYFSQLLINPPSHFSAKEQKRIVLLNALSIVGIVSNLFFGFTIYFFWGLLPLFYGHVFGFISMAIVNISQRFGYYQTAKVAFWLILYGTVFVFSKILNTASTNDYYFSILAVLPLLFFDKKSITITGLVLSILGLSLIHI